MEIEYEPRFLDEVVLRAAATRPAGRLFHRERERVYGIADPEARGRAFDALNVVWYERLELDRPLAAALAEQPLVLGGVGRCAVGRPPRPREAGAELLVRAPRRGEPEPAARLLRLLLAPELLLAGEPLAHFLRRELQHVADMLDPSFGYEPRLPAVTGGPAHEQLLRERYRVVWNATVDGRLVRAGRLPAAVRAVRAQEFGRTFTGLGGEEATRAFDRFFDDPAPTHAAIVAFVAAPSSAAPGAIAPCALCGFPTADLEPDPQALPPESRAEITRDFPDWMPAAGCCRQCAELYRARPMSLRSMLALPSVR